MKSDAQIRSFLSKSSVDCLNVADLDRYMIIATDDELSDARSHALGCNNSTLVVTIKSEQQRRVERGRHEKVIERLGVLDESVKRLGRREWKTILFWIGVATFFVTSAALLRDVVDWTVFGLGRREPTNQQPASGMRSPAIQQEATVSPGSS